MNLKIATFVKYYNTLIINVGVVVDLYLTFTQYCVRIK